jgi:hypothetical protein
MSRNNTILPLIIECIAMNLHEKEALEYLKDKGFKISHDTFYRYKRQIKNSRFERLSLIAKEGFVDQHLQRITQLEMINQEYWKLYRQEKDNFKKAQILEKIAELQTYISPYYDASRYVMEKSIQDDKQKKSESISSI